MGSARERIERLAGAERWSEEQWTELDEALTDYGVEVSGPLMAECAQAVEALLARYWPGDAPDPAFRSRLTAMLGHWRGEGGAA